MSPQRTGEMRQWQHSEEFLEAQERSVECECEEEIELDGVRYCKECRKVLED